MVRLSASVNFLWWETTRPGPLPGGGPDRVLIRPHQPSPAWLHEHCCPPPVVRPVHCGPPEVPCAALLWLVPSHDNSNFLKLLLKI